MGRKEKNREERGGKVLSWADQDRLGNVRNRDEKKKEGRGRTAKSPKREKVQKKTDPFAVRKGKDESMPFRQELSGSEDDLTKELLALLSPPPKIHIPESFDPSKVGQLDLSSFDLSHIFLLSRKVIQCHHSCGKVLLAVEEMTDSPDMKGEKLKDIHYSSKNI